MDGDLDTAFRLADIADGATLRRWRPTGVASRPKLDGSPVTDADIAAEEAVLCAVQAERSGDGFLGEEIGEREGTTGRRWIVDGIDGTRFFAAGRPTWGTLIALEVEGEIVLGMSSSPAQDRRWWAVRGEGAFTGPASSRAGVTRLKVSQERRLRADRLVTLPAYASLTRSQQMAVAHLTSSQALDLPWSHQNRVAEGVIDACIWFCGDVWDHAAPSILVEEAGGQFSDHHGGRRLDTRTAVYSNGLTHRDVIAALESVAHLATDADS